MLKISDSQGISQRVSGDQNYFTYRKYSNQKDKASAVPQTSILRNPYVSTTILKENLITFPKLLGAEVLTKKKKQKQQQKKKEETGTY